MISIEKAKSNQTDLDGSSARDVHEHLMMMDLDNCRRLSEFASVEERLSHLENMMRTDEKK